MRTILLCVNARLLHSRASGRVNAVRRLFESSGRRVEVVPTLPFGNGPSLTPDLLTTLAPDAVVVCGGDGTVLDALQSVAATSIPLGVVPFGTGNILAQNLGLRGSATAIAARLLRAEPCSVPLGEITLSVPQPGSYLFACAAGAGPHASVLELATHRTKSFAGKASYWAAGLQAWLRRPPQAFEAVVTNTAGVTTAWRVCEAIALRVPALNVWRAGGALEAASLRLAMVPATGRIGMATAITRAILAREVAQAATAAELQQLLEHNGERTLPGRAAVFYQDVVRVVCRPLPEDSTETALLAQADGEVLPSSTTTIALSDKRVTLLFPTFS